MHILGHVGFTLAGATLVQKIRQDPPLTLRQLIVFAGVSLVPDILDRILHLLFPQYPDHLLFHSAFLYAIAGLILWVRHSRFLVYVIILAFHLVLDVPNTDPRYLLFPLFGWPDPSHSVAPLTNPLMTHLPAFLSVTDRAGHYLVFELVGTFLTVWACWIAVKNSRNAG